MPTTSKTRDPLSLIPAGFALEAFAAPVMVRDDEIRVFKMEAYTGAVFDVGFGPAVIDIGSLIAPDAGVPILRQHNFELFVGRSSRIERTTTLLVEGLLFSGVDEAEEVAAISDQGGMWQASVGISIDFEGMEDVADGESVVVNGKNMQGPFLLLRSATLNEVSFVPLGADKHTSAVALADDDSQQMEAPVANQKQDGPSLEDEQKRVAELSAAFAEDAKFALEAITKGWSLLEAKAERSEALEAKLAQLAEDHLKKIAELEAAQTAALAEAKKKPAPVASPAAVLSGYSPAPGAGLDPADAFEKAVAAECAILRDLGSSGLQRGGGLSLGQSEQARACNVRALAVQRVYAKHPELHAAYLAAHNATVSKRRGR